MLFVLMDLLKIKKAKILESYGEIFDLFGLWILMEYEVYEYKNQLDNLVQFAYIDGIILSYSSQYA